MDTTFIKMCDCPEIQGLRPISHYNTAHKETVDLWEDGDWFSADGEIYTYGGNCYRLKRFGDEKPDLGSAGYHEGAGGHVEKVIWLPTQSQLQKMYDQHIYGSPWWILGQFKDFYQGKRWVDGCLKMEPEYLSYITQFASMEQLWLAFVMKEKHGKVWSDKGWVIG